jgi:hypothetical protein
LRSLLHKIEEVWVAGLFKVKRASQAAPDIPACTLDPGFRRKELFNIKRVFFTFFGDKLIRMFIARIFIFYFRKIVSK